MKPDDTDSVKRCVLVVITYAFTSIVEIRSRWVRPRFMLVV